MSCPFCARIAAGEYDNRTTPDPDAPHWGAVTFEPLNPVTPGHRLVVPIEHVEDALASPEVAAWTMDFAARVPRLYGIKSCNLITSVGAPATQTVRHLHIHIVPRHEGDGLALPWTGQLDVGREAEVLHSEHHPGTFVPTLDSCPGHERAEYERLIREMRARGRS